MEIGIDSFVPAPTDAGDSAAHVRRMAELLEQVELADRVGLDVFGIGEHHRPDYIASAPAVILAAAAARTKSIRLSSAVTVLSSDDPVRVFQQFATLDLISNGRAEIVVGRGSFTESYPLFGYDLEHYDELFKEKLDLLLKIRDSVEVFWKGKHRTPLDGQGVYPRPVQTKLPVRLGVGGTPGSFVRAGKLGLPLTVAIIGGEPWRFRPLIDRYREAARSAGHDPDELGVAIHAFGFVAENEAQAVDAFYPAFSETMAKIGRERGWPPQSRAQFDAMRSSTGALLVGDPESVAAKIVGIDEALGGISRISIQVDPSTVNHAAAMNAIE